MRAEARRAAVLLALALAACAPPPPLLLESRWPLFGTFATARVAVPPERREAGERALAELAALWQGFHRDWHPWEEGALTRLNRELAEGGPAEPAPSLGPLLAEARRIERLSGGRVAPALGRLYAAWGFHRSDPEAAPPPDPALLARLLAAPPRLDDLLEERGRLRSRHPLLWLDLSALAEGMALAEGARLLARHGIRDALLSLGGETLALGRHPSGRPWRVALRHPVAGLLGELELGDGEGLFASGSYARFRDAGGRRLAHVIDPRNGQPLERVATAAVLHRDPARADGGATALLVGGAADFATLSSALGLGCALYYEPGKGLWITAALRARLRLAPVPEPLAVYDAGATCDPPLPEPR